LPNVKRFIPKALKQSSSRWGQSQHLPKHRWGMVGNLRGRACLEWSYQPSGSGHKGGFADGYSGLDAYGSRLFAVSRQKPQKQEVIASDTRPGFSRLLCFWALRRDTVYQLVLAQDRNVLWHVFLGPFLKLCTTRGLNVVSPSINSLPPHTETVSQSYPFLQLRRCDDDSLIPESGVFQEFFWIADPKDKK